jgi:outer membrane protein assembly factor BamB
LCPIKISEKKKKMQKLNNKTTATIFAIILIASMAISMCVLPTAKAGLDNATATAKAQGMKWDFTGADNTNASATRLLLWNRWHDQVPTYVFISPTPNPVGVGQEMTFIFFNPQVPTPSTDRYLYTITITKPDQSTEVLPPAGAQGIYNEAIQDGKIVSDSTGSAWTTWTPDQVGNYTVTIKFWGTAVSHTDPLFTNRDWYGVTLQPSTYTTTFVVQQEPVISSSGIVVPLPTEYWTRPIEGQNTGWYQVASNWYNNVHDADNGGSDNRYQADGIAPNSGHILWTKPTEDGGVVGGDSFKVPGDTFNAGHQYQTRWDGNQIIMDGRLYYRESNWYSASPGDYVCVDLLTGQEIWRNRTMSAIPSFGYQYEWDDMNQHGVVEPGWLFSSNYATAIHPRFGITATLSLTNVPSGTSVYGPKGEELRYALTNVGNSTKPVYVLTQWNSSKVFISQTSGFIPANCPITPARPASQYWNGTAWQSSSANSTTSPAYDWNVTLSVTFSNSPSIKGVMFNDVLLVSNGTLPTAPSYTYAQNATFWGFNLNSTKGAIGNLLWGPTNIDLVTSKNQDFDFQRAAEGVFVFQVDPDMSWVAYSMYTGQKLWDSMSYPEGSYNPFAYYISSTGYNPSGNAIAYGKLFSTGYVGMVFCYDLQTGTLLWRQAAPTHMEKFEYYTLMVGSIADGKIYIGTHEHSADTPLFKGAKVRCYNVTDGTPIWIMDGWANPHTVQIADGVLTYWNNYDAQIYAVGKGPSALTVDAPANGLTLGSSLVIRGTVTDISAGTKQNEQAARFPNGVPAVSDASMSDWMAYVYMQKPMPTNTTGVPVSIDVLDANGNYRNIGKATSDGSGAFSLHWTPDITGQYTVIATFAGSESYWPSHSETSFAVDAAAPTASPYPIVNLPPTEMYFAISTIAIIIVIAIIGALIMLTLRKRP